MSEQSLSPLIMHEKPQDPGLLARFPPGTTVTPESKLETYSHVYMM